ncbi:MAG TPA: DnaB-like helicase C-terminal domain-containing protein, partial [Niabella sp.]|nr:DnaB-like helicase C-terminal domain-containing protein [Niabella sp.]
MPPNNREAEEIVLGAILLEKGALDRIGDVISPKMFYVEAHEKIYSAMVSLADRHEPVDYLTVKEELERMGMLDLVGGILGIVKLTNKVSSSAHIEAHANLIKGNFIKRELVRVSSIIQENALDPTVSPKENIELAERLILEIGQSSVGGEMITISDVMRNALNQINEWGKNDSYITGVATGFSELDSVTRGWQPTDLIILGARPSVGKTAMALTYAKAAAESGTTVGVWSLEMKSVMLGIRMLASESGVYMNKLQIGRLDDMAKRATITAAEKLSKLPILFDEGMNVTINSLKRRARVMKKKNNLGL